jgi:signal transduction histidine kinase
MLLWLGSATRHIPPHTGPVAASLAAPDPRAVADVAHIEIPMWSAFLVLASLGALIGKRQPRNPLGWVLASAGVLAAFRMFADGYAAFAAGDALGRLASDAETVVWVSSWLTYGPIALIGIALLLSPQGRLPGARWRPVLLLQFASLGLLMAANAIAPGPLTGWPYTDNPFGLSALDGAPARVFQLGVIGEAVGLGLAVVSLVSRLLHARGEERQQVKWVLYGARVLALGFAGLVFRATAPAESAGWRDILQLIFTIALVVFFLCLGVGVLRYRLYQIDVVLNRTLVYGALAVGITVVYAGVVVGVGSLVGALGRHDPATGTTETLTLSLVATAVVAVAFQPLRERVQRVANRLVYGRRLSPYEVLADFSRRMAGALSVDAVLPRLAQATAIGIGATRTRVRVYVPGGRDQAIAWPANALAEQFERTTPVHHQGALVGEIAVSKPSGEPLTAIEHALLDDLAAQAGPALGNVRLAADLRVQAEELRKSRQRIVAAQDQERRRIERDLHDGAQQHLVAMAVNLQIVEDLLGTDPDEAASLLSEVRGEVSEALGTLRNLARGIYPPALAEHGLGAALEAHLVKTFPAVRLESDTAAVDLRSTPEVEAAGYFCVLEALQNCAKHAPHAKVRVRLYAEPDHLTFEVSDDGPGFAQTRSPTGTGLQGMADRLAAVGASLTVRSEPGSGTVVTGRLPLELSRVRGEDQTGSGAKTHTRVTS